MNTSSGTEKINEQGVVETKVDTVDYRSPAGENQEPKKVDIEVIHQTPKDDDSGTGGGVVAGAAATVKKTFYSAKDAVFGSGNKTTK